MLIRLSSGMLVYDLRMPSVWRPYRQMSGVGVINHREEIGDYSVKAMEARLKSFTLQFAVAAPDARVPNVITRSAVLKTSANVKRDRPLNSFWSDVWIKSLPVPRLHVHQNFF